MLTGPSPTITKQPTGYFLLQHYLYNASVIFWSLFAMATAAGAFLARPPISFTLNPLLILLSEQESLAPRKCLCSLLVSLPFSFSQIPADFCPIRQGPPRKLPSTPVQTQTRLFLLPIISLPTHRYGRGDQEDQCSSTPVLSSFRPKSRNGRIPHPPVLYCGHAWRRISLLCLRIRSCCMA